MGLSTIAASIDEQADTIEEVYEPYLCSLDFWIERLAGGWRRTARLNISNFRDGSGSRDRRIRYFRTGQTTKIVCPNLHS